MTDESGSARYWVVGALIGLLMAALVFRLVVLHLGLSEQSRKPIAQTRDYRTTLAVGRGRIFDGSVATNLFAVNVGVKDIWADPAVLSVSNRAAAVARVLAPLFGVAPTSIVARIDDTNRHFAFVQRYVSDEKATVVTGVVGRLKIPGVHLQPSTIRSYPQGDLLCHVLGFVNYDGVGSAGLEQSLEKCLHGNPGVLVSRLDGRHSEVYEYRKVDVPGKDGSDVELTIDQNLQYMLEKALTSALDRNHAQAGWAIMQRVRTGEILALASRPGFDPNAFRVATDDQKLNRAIGFTYEPGSTFKVGIIAAALNEGLVTPDTIIDCENGQWLYQNKILHDTHRHGQLTVADVLKKSSNIGAAKIGIMLGPERMDRYLRGFNIGHKLGIDLPGEESGILWPVSKWSAISSSRIAMGQGVAVTGLQMLGVLCGIANDGVIMKPYVVKRIVDADGKVVLNNVPHSLGNPIRSETAAVMRRLLTRVTEEGGTGVKATVDGFRVAGKTGTAQKVVGGHYSDYEYMASFVGFLPAENPEIGLIVVVDSPQPSHTGGAVSAPVFSEVAEQAVRYLGIIPPAAAVADNATGHTRPRAP